MERQWARLPESARGHAAITIQISPTPDFEAEFLTLGPWLGNGAARVEDGPRSSCNLPMSPESGSEPVKGMGEKRLSASVHTPTSALLPIGTSQNETKQSLPGCFHHSID